MWGVCDTKLAMPSGLSNLAAADLMQSSFSPYLLSDRSADRVTEYRVGCSHTKRHCRCGRKLRNTGISFESVDKLSLDLKPRKSRRETNSRTRSLACRRHF